MDGSVNRDGIVAFHSSSGVEVSGTLVRLDRHHVVFEVYSPMVILHMSESLDEFAVTMRDRRVFSGRAVVKNLIATGAVTVVEVSIDEGWLEQNLFEGGDWKQRLGTAFQDVVTGLNHGYRIRPEFKVVVADMQMALMDSRQWLEQVELGIRSAPSGDRNALEQDVAAQLGPAMTSVLTTLFEKFEVAAANVDEELIPAHTAFARRQLHPLLLCSPFLYRCFTKPLGYAGDYEMVNMILRSPYEGGSLFAKLVNLWFLSQAPAQAHRNRVDYLCQKLVEETVRTAAQGKRARVFNVACGPAGEVQRFLREQEISGKVDFTLLDFNEETLQFGASVLATTKEQCNRNTGLSFQKRSIHQLLKEAGRSVAQTPDRLYDVVYCAGLFDYLADPVCKKLFGVLYEYLAPGGILITTNVDDSNPRRLTMEYIMEWRLIYRTGKQMANLRFERLPPEATRVTSDLTGVNLYCETRKPASV
jgi:extracellular factor (EF) 3-hydroxypalmitic acid methyl ester biosynthesis protein